MTIEIGDLSLRQSVIGSSLDDSAPDFNGLLTTFAFFDAAILHHQLAPVSEEIRITRRRFNQQRVLIGRLGVPLVIDKLVNKRLSQIGALGCQRERLLHPLTGLFNSRRGRQKSRQTCNRANIFWVVLDPLLIVTH